MNIKGLDKWFGILWVFTLVVGIANTFILFYLDTDIAFIITGAIWLTMTFLWSLLALRFRRMAYEFACQKLDADIRDILRGAVSDPAFVRVINNSVSVQKMPIVVSVGERQFPISSMEELDKLKSELGMV